MWEPALSAKKYEEYQLEQERWRKASLAKKMRRYEEFKKKLERERLQKRLVPPTFLPKPLAPFWIKYSNPKDENLSPKERLNLFTSFIYQRHRNIFVEFGLFVDSTSFNIIDRYADPMTLALLDNYGRNPLRSKLNHMKKLYKESVEREKKRIKVFITAKNTELQETQCVDELDRLRSIIEIKNERLKYVESHYEYQGLRSNIERCERRITEPEFIFYTKDRIKAAKKAIIETTFEDMPDGIIGSFLWLDGMHYSVRSDELKRLQDEEIYLPAAKRAYIELS